MSLAELGLTVTELIILGGAYLSVALMHMTMCVREIQNAKAWETNCRSKDVKNAAKKIAMASRSRLKFSLFWPLLILLAPLALYRSLKWTK
tara:strand:+ start:1307 stop:1579 length:273 start_codon:yes stop_codon:yes gene_type:complete